MNNKYTKLMFLLFILPTLVFANAGSPMMWFGVVHGLILNFAISIIESSIIRKYGIDHRTWLILVVNYISMAIGLFYIAPFFASISGNNDFWGGQTDYSDYTIRGFIIGMIASFFATLIIEFPFAFFAVKDRSQRGKLLKPFLIANTVTNVAMTAIYYFIIKNGAS